MNEVTLLGLVCVSLVVTATYFGGAQLGAIVVIILSWSILGTARIAGLKKQQLPNIKFGWFRAFLHGPVVFALWVFISVKDELKKGKQ